MKGTSFQHSHISVNHLTKSKSRKPIIVPILQISRGTKTLGLKATNKAGGLPKPQTLYTWVWPQSHALSRNI